MRSDLMSLPKRWLHRSHEYGVLWLGLGVLGTICLALTLFAVPLIHVLPKRWASPFGRRASTHLTRFYLRVITLIGACRFDLSELDANQRDHAEIKTG